MGYGETWNETAIILKTTGLEYIDHLMMHVGSAPVLHGPRAHTLTLSGANLSFAVAVLRDGWRLRAEHGRALQLRLGHV